LKPAVRILTAPPVLFLVCLTTGLLLQRARPLDIDGHSFLVGMATGCAALLLAVGLAAWGILELKRQATPIEPGSTPTRLVSTGPYRFSRNPLYVALLLVHAGIAAMTGSWWLVMGTVALFGMLDRVVVVREEAVIRQTFGAEYAAYRSRVRRWL